MEQNLGRKSITNSYFFFHGQEFMKTEQARAKDQLQKKHDRFKVFRKQKVSYKGTGISLDMKQHS